MEAAQVEIFSKKRENIFLYRLLSCVLGGVFLAAGILKGLDLMHFVRQIHTLLTISNPAICFVIACIVVFMECVLGAALIVFLYPRTTLISTGIVLLIFILLTSWTWWTQSAKDCGCFGRWIQRSPAEALTEDFVLLLLTAAAYLFKPCHNKRPKRYQLFFLSCAALMGLLLPISTGFAKLDSSYISAKKKTFDLRNMQIEGLSETQRHYPNVLVVMMDTECNECKKAVPLLNHYAEDPALPPIIALSPNSKPQVEVFVNEQQPMYPIGRIEPNSFWDLLDDSPAPRYLLITDHQIQKSWSLQMPNIEELEH